MDVLKQVYYAICKDSLHTRKEIAEYIGVSTVTVGKAVDTLTQNGFITSRGKLSGELGRKSEFLDIDFDIPSSTAGAKYSCTVVSSLISINLISSK